MTRKGRVRCNKGPWLDSNVGDHDQCLKPLSTGAPHLSAIFEVHVLYLSTFYFYTFPKETLHFLPYYIYLTAIVTTYFVD